MSKTSISFLETMMEHILEGVNIPKVQVEREISPILGMFIGEVLTETFKDDKKLQGEYELVLPEFPLKKYDNNQSTNIDYLLVNKCKKTLVFLELKTDNSSFSQDQLDIYHQLKENSMDKYKKDLEDILKGSNLKSKYKYVLDRYETVLKDIGDIRDQCLIYLVPKATKESKNFEGVPVLSFSELAPKIPKHKFSDEWEIVHKYLKKFDVESILEFKAKIEQNIEKYAEDYDDEPVRYWYGKTGISDKSAKPNYQVEFKGAGIKTFNFNGTPLKHKSFNSNNLSSPVVWNKKEQDAASKI